MKLHRNPWSMLVLVSLAQLLAMSVWFSASSVSTHLQERLQLETVQVGWLTSSVQLGFVAGTLLAVLLNLADLLPARRYVAASSAGAGLVNALLLLEPGYGPTLALRFLTGVFLAGVYPPAMKMVATWFQQRRGLAIGAVVGALILGKASPYLIKVLAPEAPAGVIGAASASALLGAVLILLLYRDGPHAFARPRFDWRAAQRILAHRPTRLAIAGYLGHMWELYAMWTWLPVFLLESQGRRGGSAWVADLIAYLSIAMGALGSVAGGLIADRIGRELWVNLCMAISGACCLVVGLFFGSSPLVLVVLGAVWGLFVVADSAQFSAMVTEVADPDIVGTALTLQTSLGFLLTLLTIQLVGELAASMSWRWAFPVLALGPAFGIASIESLRRRP